MKKQFKILTNLTCKYVNAKGDQELLRALYCEQEIVLEKTGFKMNEFVWITNGKIATIITINDAITSLLSIKEGGDLVQFENGRIGFVGYYGISITYFEIIGHSSFEEKIDMETNHMQIVNL